jgi:hypothetical protein
MLRELPNSGRVERIWTPELALPGLNGGLASLRPCASALKKTAAQLGAPACMDAVRLQADLLAVEYAFSRRSPQVAHQGLPLSIRV